MSKSEKKSCHLVAVIASFILFTPGMAAAEEDKWLLRAVGGWNRYSESTTIPSEDGDLVRLGAKDDFNLGIEAEYRASRRLGIEIGMLYSRPEINVSVDSVDGQRFLLASEMTFRPITAGLVFHLTPDRRVDLTLTPLVGYAFFSDLHFRFQGATATLDVDRIFVQGARLAADVPLGESRWDLALGLRYLGADLEGSDPDGERFDIDLDPLTLTVGFGIHF
jgi:hypothetical protein